MLGKTDGSEFRLWIVLCQQLLSPVVIGGIVYACFLQVILNRLAALLQVQLQYFKFFFCHDTITVVVGCTIADAKVQLNYNCYNVYFYECLLISSAGDSSGTVPAGKSALRSPMPTTPTAADPQGYLPVSARDRDRDYTAHTPQNCSPPRISTSFSEGSG